MKKWSGIIIASCAFLLLIGIINLWLLKGEQSKLENISASLKELEQKGQTKEPVMPPLDALPSIKLSKQEKDLGIKNDEVLDIVSFEEIISEEEIREAERLGIRPKEEELEDLKKKQIIFY